LISSIASSGREELPKFSRARAAVLGVVSKAVPRCTAQANNTCAAVFPTRVAIAETTGSSRGPGLIPWPQGAIAKNTISGVVNLSGRGTLSPGMLRRVSGMAQAVTVRQTPKDRDRKNRWLLDVSKCRPTRNRFWMASWSERNRCACRADLNRRICRSRWRVS